jgi:phosphatidylglycerophosphate synthase
LVGETAQSISVSRPQRAFPLIRHLSSRMTACLVRLPVTPNQITLASIGLGLAGVWCFLGAGRGRALAGALLFLISYVLDNCDGEVARLKRMQSRLGRMLDEVGDWFVHSALFIALGFGLSESLGHQVWLWLGWSGAAGVTIENALGWFVQAHAPPLGGDAFGNVSPADLPGDTTWADRAVYVLRALFDADFCFILLAFTVADALWLLVAGAAVGNHVFWAASLYENGRLYHG